MSHSKGDTHMRRVKIDTRMKRTRQRDVTTGDTPFDIFEMLVAKNDSQLRNYLRETFSNWEYTEDPFNEMAANKQLVDVAGNLDETHIMAMITDTDTDEVIIKITE